MRGLAEAVAGAGFHVELPRLPGHGTTVEDMLTTIGRTGPARSTRPTSAWRSGPSGSWSVGLSMGGALTLWTGLQHLEVAGIVCVNPADQAAAADVHRDARRPPRRGHGRVPGIGGDIADPDGRRDRLRRARPVPLLSSIDDGLAPMADRYGELQMPLLLFTSRQDHVVEPSQSEHLAATYGGPVDHRWLERSYHVATQDFDRDVIFAGRRVRPQGHSVGADARRVR